MNHEILYLTYHDHPVSFEKEVLSSGVNVVNEIDPDLSRRSSSSWTKNSLASLRISVALRSSFFSRYRALM